MFSALRGSIKITTLLATYASVKLVKYGIRQTQWFEDLSNEVVIVQANDLVKERLQRGDEAGVIWGNVPVGNPEHWFAEIAKKNRENK